MKWRSSLESKQHQSSTNNIPISSSQSSSVFVPMKKEKVKKIERKKINIFVAVFLTHFLVVYPF